MSGGTSQWICSGCGRGFRKMNQNHFCKEASTSTIDQYIEAQSEGVRPILRQMRETIRRAAPDAVETISWQMPTFRQGENLIHFAAAKKHIGLYPGDEAVRVFADRLQEYKCSKGSIQLPLDRPIDHTLIADITRWRVEQAESKNRKTLNPRLYEFDEVIGKVPEMDGAYVPVPYDIRAEFGRGRVKVHATFDGEPYDGSVVNMGLKNPDGSICYLIGLRKDIRGKIGKEPGDSVRVTMRERE